MSEYQSYEFRAIDRPLTREEMEELRRISTRAQITPTSFTNTYQWGNFKGDPLALMDNYFDAFVYTANWGTHVLMLRLPQGLLDVEAAREYCDEEVVSLKVRKQHIVLVFKSHKEEGYWEETNHDWTSLLVPIRDELLRGDLRALYVAWLSSFADRGWIKPRDPEGEIEPPVPAGLAKPSEPLQALANFLRVNPDLLEASAAASATDAVAPPSPADLERWIKTLPAAEKDAYLVRFLAQDGDPLLRAELARRFREATARQGPTPPTASQRRTVAELLEATAALSSEKARKASEKAAIEKASRERTEAEARTSYLDVLAGQVEQTWRTIEKAIATKRPSEYDRAIELLVDLRELAERSGKSHENKERTRELRAKHSNKPSLQKRFDAKGFTR